MTLSFCAGCKAEEDNHRRRCTEDEEKDISQRSRQCGGQTCQKEEDCVRTGVALCDIFFLTLIHCEGLVLSVTPRTLHSSASPIVE